MKKGKLPQFSHAIEGHLRERLKLPCFLNEGTVELLQDVFLAKDGVRITADQSRLLKLFGKFSFIFVILKKNLRLRRVLKPFSIQNPEISCPETQKLVERQVFPTT